MSADTSTTTDSIQALPAVDQTLTDQIFELRALSADVRDRHERLAEPVGQLHDHVQEIDLHNRAAALSQNDPGDLLAMLGDLGMPWSLVASLVGVTPTAVRKWRRGGALTPDSRSRLARLVAFCQILAEVSPTIDDAALWIQTPIVAGSTTLTPAHLFAAGGDEIALLNRATDRISAAQLLDGFEPSWRTTTRPDDRHRVVEASDGVLSIVPVE